MDFSPAAKCFIPEKKKQKTGKNAVWFILQLRIKTT